MNDFVKMQGLGNDYLVFDEEKINFKVNEKFIKKVCNTNWGIGSDGVLLKIKSKNLKFGLKIFNPDGSIAEKSGNGLRIFCKYLYDYKYVKDNKFLVETDGGIVKAEVIKSENEKARIISIDMGKAEFDSKLIPTDFEEKISLGEKIIVKDREFLVNCVSIGNPHCVIIENELSIDKVKKYGKLIENHSKFPNRINVQFVKIISRKEVEILIWERGAGFTLASGTSSCAVVSVLKKLGLVENEVKVNMIGGNLNIKLDENYNIKLIGEVRKICDGIIDNEFLESI
ncbi:diaminopimelate epimerase [Eubacterium multiforme]|uniref:Diaminopimelate epimerase n=1 Tax=Eubacterium multiforme TaxID=83339 RepID=A0ABT9UTP2_9FIRM|nr:diaminopimelate epimerase [Eubacterium multiforme]MDQ0149664.1 diaminopimelate epimerase [Eubacterium multiforme]